MTMARRLSLPVALVLSAIGILLVPGGRRAAAPQGSTEQKLWSVYWTVAPGYTSILEMKNNPCRGDSQHQRVSLFRERGGISARRDHTGAAANGSFGPQPGDRFATSIGPIASRHRRHRGSGLRRTNRLFSDGKCERHESRAWHCLELLFVCTAAGCEASSSSRRVLVPEQQGGRLRGSAKRVERTSMALPAV